MTNYLPAENIFNLVKQNKVVEALKQKISENFTWGEVFQNCTIAEIEAAPLQIYKNAILQATTMQKVRAVFKKPVNVHCWYRGDIIKDRNGKTHNQDVGGAKGSYHTKALATDFSIDGISPNTIHKTLNPLPFMRFCGMEDIVYNGVHVDARGYKARFSR